MYGTPPANRPFPSSPYGHRKEESEIQRQNQMSSGLLRYRSAPSSLFGEICEDFPPVRPSSPETETETILARFLSPDLRDEIRDKNHPVQRNPRLPPVSAEMLFQQQQQQQQIPSNLVTSIGMEVDQIKNGSNNLVRQSSSPAGLFSPLNAENGYGVMRGIGGFRNGNDGGGGTRLKSQLSFSWRQSSSAAAMMSQISEEMEENESMTGYRIGTWEDSPMVSENNFSGGIKRARENQSEQLQNGEGRNGLTHQFSLPKTSSEIAAIEKFLQFQDSVPCKIRAKRGCATHPRSIAERVRRTRISERMRKLQELVPNMDKQTNTADMLDLAVEYIKDLQKQVNIISDSRASCTCSSSKKKPYTNSTT